MRTGDLGFINNGQLYIFGRIKDIIIIRGRKYAPQDIEFAVENAHESIRKGNVVAFSVDIDSVERLVIVAELSSDNKNHAYEQLFTDITRLVSNTFQLAIYEIVLIAPKTQPKTTSGKVQRHFSKKHYLSGELKTIASWKTPSIDTPPAPQQTPKSLEEWEITNE